VGVLGRPSPISLDTRNRRRTGERCGNVEQSENFAHAKHAEELDAFRIYLDMGRPRVFFPLHVFSDDADLPRDLTTHVGIVRGVLEQMDHTFAMARARSDLRAAIKGFRQSSASAAPVGEGGERAAGLGSARAAGEIRVEGKEVGGIR